ncbi:hypothetical protein ACLI09_06465 [Flavobacterium sp. RHBU_24]|uniref:hypothetical protein n=1 Tax=Flavobacterium sp. RHBU_24 TaxID=3391185 RepID=UPI003984E868
MKLFISSLAILLIPICLFGQEAKFTPPSPKYKINGQAVIYEGYIISRDGAKAYTEKREPVGFCFNYEARLPVIKEVDSLVMVAFSKENRNDDYEFLYVSKKSIGNETDIPLDNYDLNERYVYNESWRYENVSSAEDCGESNETPIEKDAFNPDDYPDALVELVSEKDFFNAELKAIDYLTIDKSIKKVDETITIGGQKFTDDVSEEGAMLINAFTYVGDYKAVMPLCLNTCVLSVKSIATYLLINRQVKK